MIRKLVAKFITKTNLIRNAAVGIAGSLVAAGVIEPESAEAVVAGAAVIFAGLLNYWVERIHAAGVKDVQRVLHAEDDGLVEDGWAGPRTLAALLRRGRR